MAVAVVVGSIAPFSYRLCGCALLDTIDTGRWASALTDAAGRCLERLIGAAVAVIISSIAENVREPGWLALATIGRISVRVHPAGLALTRASTVEAGRTIAETAARIVAAAAVRRIPQKVEGLVDAQVAVVVEAVALLDSRLVGHA